LTELIGVIISILVSLSGFITAAIKYGADQQKLKSKNELQDQVQESFAKDCSESKNQLREKLNDLEKRQEKSELKNDDQHREFYKVKDDTIEIKSTLNYIIKGIEEIKEAVKK
jgi:hypothetical protein